MKKIMFSDKFGLTEAVLNGEKTMTRRVIKGDYVKVVHLKHEGSFIGKIANGDSVIPPQPVYKVGEEVAIAQAYGTFLEIYPEPQVRFDGYCNNMHWDDHLCSHLFNSPGYKNKMYVRSELMPHCIEITGYRAERLQDISDEDCLLEGVEKWIKWYFVPGIMGNHGKSIVFFNTPREAFAALIDRISGKGTWQRNPWVYAYTFKLLR